MKEGGEVNLTLRQAVLQQVGQACREARMTRREGGGQARV